MTTNLQFKPVFFQHRNAYVYGQVVSSNARTVTVRTPTAEIKVAASKVEEVAPVVCLLLQHARLRVRDVPPEALQEHHATILDRLLGLNGHEATRDVTEILRGILPSTSVPEPKSACSWIDPTTEEETLFHLRHAVDFGYFVDGDRPIPRDLRPLIGETFMDQPPAVLDAPVERASSRTTHGTNSRNEPNASLNALLAEFERDAEHAPARSVQEELITLISSKPHVLSFYLDQCITNSRKRPAQTELDDERATQRLRYASTEPLSPQEILQADESSDHRSAKESSKLSSYQRAVHSAIVAPKYSGKTPSTFLDIASSSPARQFPPHQGIMSSLFDFRFGVQGISIAHLVLFDKRGKDKWNRDKKPTTQSVKGAELPERPTLTRLQDLRDNLAVLETFAQEFYNETTCKLISAALDFSKRLSVLASWDESDIMELADWFDDAFQAYRHAVQTWLTTGHDERSTVRNRFSESDPKFLLLLFNIQSHRPSRWIPGKPPATSKTVPQSTETSRSKVPADVLDALPKQGGKSVCMRHLSRKGCPTKTPGRCIRSNLAHFTPKMLPPLVRHYIDEHLGGVREDIA